MMATHRGFSLWLHRGSLSWLSIKAKPHEQMLASLYLDPLHLDPLHLDPLHLQEASSTASPSSPLVRAFQPRTLDAQRLFRIPRQRIHLHGALLTRKQRWRAIAGRRQPPPYSRLHFTPALARYAALPPGAGFFSQPPHRDPQRSHLQASRRAPIGSQQCHSWAPVAGAPKLRAREASARSSCHPAPPARSPPASSPYPPVRVAHAWARALSRPVGPCPSSVGPQEPHGWQAWLRTHSHFCHRR